MKRFHFLSKDWLLPSISALIVATSGIAALQSANARGSAADLFSGSYQRAYEDRFEQALPFRRTAQDAWAAARMVLFGEVSVGALMSDSGWLFTLEEFVTPVNAPDFVRELQQTKIALAEHGIRLIPVIVPDKARIMQTEHSFPRTEALDARYDNALEAVTQLGLPSIDTRAALERLGHAAYFRTDTHWTPEGAAAVANKLTEALPDVAVASTFETHISAHQALEGDLLAFAQTGAFAQWVGPKTEVQTLFETLNSAENLDLFADVDIPIVLVGTSFSARTDLHFDGFLKSALGLDVINLATEGEGPFAPMRRLLSDAAFEINPPQFVIWEIPERYIDPRSFQ
jgi:alginate O-acetyltransferase complex protein AlgJ